MVHTKLQIMTWEMALSNAWPLSRSACLSLSALLHILSPSHWPSLPLFFSTSLCGSPCFSHSLSLSCLLTNYILLFLPLFLPPTLSLSP